MRLKLFHKLFAAIACVSLASVLLFAAGTQWYTQRSFVRYLNEERSARLDDFAAGLAEYFAAAGSWDDLASDPRAWRRLLYAQARSAQDRDADAREPDRGAPPPTPTRSWRHLPNLFTLYDAERRILVGELPYAAALEVRPITRAGRTVGWLGVRPVARPDAPRERRYARRQMYMVLVGAGVAALLSVLGAWWLARRLAQPIRAMGEGARALAAGHYETRLAPGGSDEIGQLAQDFNLLARTLAENEAARRRWIADTSHELRTPLAILQSEIEAAQDGIRPLDTELLRSLAVETARMQHLIDDLYQLARADIGALEYAFDILPLAPLVEAVLARFAHRFGEAGLTCHPELVPHLRVRIDRARFTQLLENLCENCCRYVTSPGHIDVRLERAGAQARLTVADSGPGVDADDRARLFEPLHRAEPSRSRQYGGAGLGLALCQRIVQAHGGAISAAASAAGGLAIVVTLPLAEA